MMEKLMRKRALLSKDMIYPGMFDLPKGLFMIGVFFFHAFIAAGYSAYTDIYTYGMAKGIVIRTVLILVGGQIPTLFFCCGYTWRKKKTKKAIDGQVHSLLTPYVVTGIVLTIEIVIYYAVFARQELGRRLVFYVLPFVFGTSPGWQPFGIRIGAVGPLWCAVTYCFGGILLNWILHEKERWIQVCIVLLLVCAGLGLSNVLLPFCLQQVLVCTGYMYLGWLMKKTNFLTTEIPVYLILVVCLIGLPLAAVSLAVFPYHDYANGMNDVISCGIVGLITLVVTLRMNHRESKLLSVIRWMGRENLLICCAHTPFVMFPTLLFGNIQNYMGGMPRMVSMLVLFVFFTITGTAGAYIVKKLAVTVFRKGHLGEGA